MARTSLSTKIILKGLTTGLILQLAIGPVFFFIVNLTLQKTFLDGFVAVCAVTLVDYFYITLAVSGIGEILENKKAKKPLGIIGSFVLIIFGFMMLKAVILNFNMTRSISLSSDLMSSFFSTFILTISNPMTIVFFTGIFSAKAMENNYSKKELHFFGFGTGLATFLFMGLAIVVFSMTKTAVPILLMQMLNGLVGGLLITYGLLRLSKILRVYKAR
ncbi:MAG: Lysine exporter protein (LYSE/YGGA) [Candidatus Uhrbacteria bacterium GW2011_GWF2_41_16]|uniref:Lysine exporter protein (LYSE/YGGA) n=2 Tax=Candidatus Uhriibacteriota TaxID=1752732 RepID=A0A0G0YDT8_9BACT|nr:MAG: Lysine exporter protein (LYSE/YGGA) [Candidatus Uhrbacteria bacterium GW2011_GWA2_41_10]KKR87502.1 MAG: Lysine exporter protein (LYSE/YGGA) [Candidatus Uhrbacteria bacterium GW2011_GWC2_41_11]KKR98482.1 MAG: Lysine exporter protein (LYSE/YGGA) [Candidatus Uhrbacteria bacterium GW2011_GWF2_41_16]